jgi:hypothetical protein
MITDDMTRRRMLTRFAAAVTSAPPGVAAAIAAMPIVAGPIVAGPIVAGSIVAGSWE